jgi:MarR family transcriptional regulator, 2-MHQ and catechol-resistance regulon repressor
MAEFITQDDGLLSEKSIHGLAAWYNEQSQKPHTLTYEAHLMLLRTHAAITAQEGPSTRAGLTRARYTVLRILYKAEGHRLLMSEIGQGLNVSPTNITKLIDGLVADDLVRRVNHPHDKRMTWAEITPKGIETFEELLPQVREHTEHLWSGLDDKEKKQLVHLLAKVLMNVTKAEKEPVAGAPA